MYHYRNVRAVLTGVVMGIAATAVGAQPADTPQQQTANPTVAAYAATHTATLNGGDEVPLVTTTATGAAWFVLDAATGTVSWTIEFAGLSGPITGAHFHGPAAPGVNAPVVVDIAAEATTSPLQGSAMLTAEQAAQFSAGEWYVNLLTEANPGGEIRGQVVAAQTSAVADAAMEALLAAGARVYRSCAGCHGNAGEGGNGDPLAANAALANTQRVVAQILFGGAYMPAFPSMSNADVAAVATYIRNSFGNELGIVEEAEVAAVR